MTTLIWETSDGNSEPLAMLIEQPATPTDCLQRESAVESGWPWSRDLSAATAASPAVVCLARQSAVAVPDAGQAMVTVVLPEANDGDAQANGTLDQYQPGCSSPLTRLRATFWASDGKKPQTS